MDNFRSNPEKISIWDLHSKIDFDEIKEIFEGEKYSKIQEKIENLRKSSDTIGLDTVGSSLDLEENTNDLVASTAPGVKFSSIEERNAHYKSDWHRWNMKLKLMEMPMISKERFLELQNEGETSQNLLKEEIKPVEEEEPKTPLKGSAKVDFITTDNLKISVWKNVLGCSSRKNYKNLVSFVEELKTLKTKQKWIIIMSSGGKFAGAIFKKDKCVKHKTFSRYTVRKKQGGSQSTRDNKGNAPSSMGATLRRHNETKFKEDISDILMDWRDDIASTDLIFLYTPGINNIYIYANGILKKDDPRIRSIPIVTSNPTLFEVNHIHHRLSTVEIEKVIEIPKSQESEEEEDDEQQLEIIEEEKQIEETEDKLTTAIENNDLTAFQELMESGYKSPDMIEFEKVACSRLNFVKYLLTKEGTVSEGNKSINAQIDVDFNRTALHLAMANGNTAIMTELLNAGANPCIVDNYGKTPYQLASTAKNKAVRDAIRRYASHNKEMWNWENARVPLLTTEMESQQKKKNLEKNKKKKQNQQQNKKKQNEEALQKQKQAIIAEKQKEEEKAKELELARIELERETALLQMTDSEKRAYYFDNKKQKNADKCDHCGVVLSAIPFHRLNYKYCTTKCVKEHMQVLEKAKK